MQPLLPWTVRAGALALAVGLAACGASRQRAGDATPERRLSVVTTVLPVTLFTRAVAGDCARVTPLIPANSGPHDFQAKPGDLLALREARVLVKNGLELEGFLDKLVASAGNPKLAVVDSSRGVTTLNTDQHGDQHHDDDGDHHGDQHANPPEPNPERRQARDQHHDHHHGPVNPHIWLDPLRAVQQVQTIRDGLVKADPSCSEGYRRRAKAFVAQLQQLHAEISDQLKTYRGQTFVAFHDFAPYFAQRYGLQAAYLVDVPELNPSPADLQRVAHAVERSQLKALLSEPQEGHRSFNALAKDLGVKVVEFDPLETASEAASHDPATYFKVMRSNAADLRQAFSR